MAPDQPAPKPFAAGRGLEPRIELTGRVAHYESFYLRANKPGGSEAFWIKYTLLRRLDGHTTGSAWLTYFNRDLERPLAFKRTVDADSIDLDPEEAIIAIGESRLAGSGATGAADRPGGSCSWNVRFAPGAPAFFHLPHERMYGLPLPKTKLLSPHPQTLFDGEIVVEGKRIDVSAWPGMVGHNWGTQHSERWIWVNCNEFDEAPDETYFDAAAGKVRIGPIVTPWMPFGMISYAGRIFDMNGARSILTGRVEDGYTGARMRLHGSQGMLDIRVGAPVERFVGLVYRDPDGKAHHTLNCSQADASVVLTPRHGEPIRLKSTGGATYEIGVLEPNHPIEMAPFDD